MKRRELVRHLETHGCPLKREGGSHSIYWNPKTGRREPRHDVVQSELAGMRERRNAAGPLEQRDHLDRRCALA